MSSGTAYIERRAHMWEVDADSGCWNWKGALTRAGYPHGYVHRRHYATAVGPIPEGHHVHHRCENTKCVNPEHLQAIAAAEHFAHHHLNKKGRTPEKVAAVRADRAAGMKLWDIAAKHGLSFAVTREWCVRSWDAEPIPPPVRECAREGCSAPFQTKHLHRIYCSERCRAAVGRALARARVQAGATLPDDGQIIEALRHAATDHKDWVQSRHICEHLEHGSPAHVGRQLLRMADEGRVSHRYFKPRQVNQFLPSTEVHHAAA